MSDGRVLGIPKFVVVLEETFALLLFLEERPAFFPRADELR